jgi:hypothetical protein
VERFYLLPDMLFAMLCAVGLEHLLEWRHKIGFILQAVGVGILCLLVLLNIPETDWSEDRAVEDYIFNALDSVRPGAVIIGTGDMNLFGFLVASEVFAYRTDVTYVDLNLVRTPWYWAQVNRALPEHELPYHREVTPVVALVDQLLQDHAVYLAGDVVPRSLEENYVLYPVGPLMSVNPRNGALPDLRQVEQINRELFDRLRFSTRVARPWNAWSRQARSFYARTWNSIADNYERVGEQTHADQLRAKSTFYSLVDRSMGRLRGW